MSNLLTVEEYQQALESLPKEEDWSKEDIKIMVNLYREKLSDIMMAETNGYNAECYIEQARKMINNLKI